jgi:glycosyltransferase involved in cell wall biosynthesis
MRILYDLSMSRGHSGTPHGLVRVEVAIAKELSESHLDVLPIWLENYEKIRVGTSAEFSSLTEGSFSDRPAFSNYGAREQHVGPQANHIEELKQIPKSNRLIVLATYSTSFFPGRLSKKLWILGKKCYQILLRIERNLSRAKQKLLSSPFKIESSFPSEMVSGLEIDEGIYSKSVVLIAGNDWDRRILERLPKKNATCKIAILIYDLIPYEYPHYSVDLATSSRFTYWIGDIAQRADFLFFISRHSQESFNKMLLERCIESSAKQMVISLPPGITPSSDISEPAFSGELENSFILVVCTIEARKNHQVLVAALRLAISMGEDFPQLVFIGSPGWGTENLVHQIRTEESLRNRIVMKAGVKDSELRWLYEKCSAAAYPSIVEGFGLPVFESAAFRKAIVTSNIPVFDEISHPFRTKVDPYDSMGWKKALQDAANVKRAEGEWVNSTLPNWKGNVEQMLDFLSQSHDF